MPAVSICNPLPGKNIRGGGIEDGFDRQARTRVECAPGGEEGMSQDCIFCRIARKEMKSEVVAEDEETFAFRDLDPQAPTHVLVIPKEHIEKLPDLGGERAELIGRLVLKGVEIARAEGLAERGFRLVLNSGAEAGQSVFHLHMHVLGGRKMGWPPG